VRWPWQPLVRAPKHVRLHVLHEATSSGDITVEGYETAAWRDDAGMWWLALERAVVLHPDGDQARPEGVIDVPVARILMRERLVAVALPELQLPVVTK